MNIIEEFKMLSDETFCSIMDCKLSKMDYQSALTVKGKWVDFPHKAIAYTDFEKDRIVRIAERKHLRNLRRMQVLWQARRRLQKALNI